MKKDKIKGLTTIEVEERKERGLINKDVGVSTKSIGRIITSNLFTLFNLLNFSIVITLLVIGSYKNILFIGTVVTNLLIGIFWEIKAKKTIDKMTLINQSKVKVIRDDKEILINRDDLVIDDIVLLNAGSQIVSDCVVLSGTTTANESLITGEEKPVAKKEGDLLLSGSFIVNGNTINKVVHVGEDNYSSKISKEAKYVKKLNSILMNSLKEIIKYISIAIIPIGTLLFLNQISIPNTTLDTAIVNTAAGIIGMIPEGLVLLISTVLSISMIKLSRYKVLVQELYCIEMLARVDVLCLDKTGTITEGIMEVADVIYLNDDNQKNLLNDICHTVDDDSPTMRAICNKFKTKKGQKLKGEITLFSSENKYSKIKTKDVTYYLGAIEMIIEDYQGTYDNYVKDYRTVFLVKEEKKRKEPLAIILLEDKIREEAKETINYFKEQGVFIKIISGDNPKTVSSIAKRIGLKDHDKYIDVSKIKSHEELEQACINKSIFGRVTPQRKKEIVLLFKKLGHTVAMTGDGVNDVLALKEADCSIALASGSEASRNVSQLVLMNSNFDSLPKVLEEGRKTINNIGRSASLFLVKTIYTTLTIVYLLFTTYNYPFKPINLTMMNFLTIGLPGFVLSLEPNKEKVSGNFLKLVLIKSLPVATTIFFVTTTILNFKRIINVSPQEISTIIIIVTTIIMFVHVYDISKPLNKLRKTLLITIIFLFVTEYITLKKFFSIAPLSRETLFYLIGFLLFGLLLNEFIKKVLVNIMSKKKDKDW